MVLSCSQMHQVFTNRCVVFHTPIMTVVFNLHPEFCRRDTDKGTDTDFDKVITDLPKEPGSPSPTLMKLQYESSGFLGRQVPWDIEMTVEETLSDDEDGDSLSQSES
jgi:hypothetical protein